MAEVAMTRPAAVLVLLAMSLGLAAGAGACGSPTEPNTQRVVGRIDPSLSSRPVVSAPAEVRAGAAFTVTVTTVGFGCTTAEGGAVVVRDDLARIVPYDRIPEPGHGTFCPEGILAILPRDLGVTLPRAGAARLRVVGLKASSPGSILDSVDIAISVLQ
jgi:hypothetical protein